MNDLLWHNPVWPHYLADPFVWRVADLYYAIGTGGPDHSGSPDSRIFPLLRSSDLKNWIRLSNALEPLSDPDAASYWAPEIAEREGRFYLYYSAGGAQGQSHRLRLAISDSPDGPYVDIGPINNLDEPFSIDASPFYDPVSGRWFLFFAKDFFDGYRPGTGTAVAALGEDMQTVIGVPQTVVRATADWQIFERNRDWYGKIWPAWHTVEGPFVWFHEQRYYCFYSGGRWDSENYGIGCAVADHPMGPFHDLTGDRGPSVLTGDNVLFGPGHNSVIASPDGNTALCVFHAWDRAHTARRMCILPLEWTGEGPHCVKRKGAD